MIEQGSEHKRTPEEHLEEVFQEAREVLTGDFDTARFSIAIYGVYMELEKQGRGSYKTFAKVAGLATFVALRAEREGHGVEASYFGFLAKTIFNLAKLYKRHAEIHLLPHPPISVSLS